ncbi:lipopolysaccharide biosynthesis protein [Streptomyces radicis]|uniref:Lipopolysaccharide biosynthesis protein n=1 Tax=Streptomyces radicis TaxID=1750517 RepID=A0A3A9WH72_9ACTN|nr:lipopolysaccharide biosynthesis protein [Streptomyces radicis]RKN12129.1 lipopolysaccharide biosynthesis protein [Streptomyces radicis]RKN25818.1 lipopolysaccharide biosynthesis protein [Streptomyces radicis]
MSAVRDDARGGAPAPPAGGYDEPDLLRDQFRQLLRYRLLIVCGILLGLAGGGWLGLTGNESYIATSEVTVRAPTADPFAGTPVDRVAMGSERRTAVSDLVARRAADELGDPDRARELGRGLTVTNPPNTEVLRFSYSHGDPDVAAERANAFVAAYLANRQADAQETIAHNVASLEGQRAPLVERRDQLETELDTLFDGSSAYDGAVADLSTLTGQISEINAQISSLQALDTSGGRVITEATAPGSPSGPGLPLLLALGYVVGIGLGLLAAWVRLVFDPTVRSPGDVTRALRAPVLGVLPRTGRGHPDQLLAAGRLAEEYRSVAFRLAYDETFAQRRRLLVVAPRGSIEASLAASVNLAAAFAEMGMDALLVEADLRTPTLAEQLRHTDGGRPGWAGSPGYREGTWPVGARVPIDAGESGIFDLVPGRRVRNVPRALTSPAATTLLGHADTKGSVVVVLAPAVLSYADAIALVDRVDNVLVVCDPSQVRRDDLARVRELVVGAGGALLGAVLHSWGGGQEGGRDADVTEVSGTRPKVASVSSRERERERRAARASQQAHRDIGSETLGLRVLDPAELEDGSPRP